MWQAALTHGRSKSTRPWPVIDGHPARLTIARQFGHNSPFTFQIMGQQLNKHIKKKRRVAYHKRRNARLRAAAAKAKK